MSRIAGTFERLDREKRCALMPYLAIGFPERDSVLELAPALVEGGADMLELGMPFSDPLADGATIQRATERALRNGIRVEDCLNTVRRLRRQGIDIPLLLMGYYNPIMRYGEERFAEHAAAAGVDGLIIPDLPPEEAEPLRAACAEREIDIIFFLTPTSTDERMAQVAQRASGFIYCVSLAGVTGARSQLSPALGPFLERVRRFSTLPRAVGFGISRPEHVAQISSMAEGAIVASALINKLEQLPPAQHRDAAREFVAALSSATRRG